MLSYFKNKKSVLTASLRRFLDAKAREFSEVNDWGQDGCERLFRFTSQGKMIRGGLVLLAHEIFGGGRAESAVSVGVAAELFQSAFLIHDDIMDRDDLRRNEPSVHYQYRMLGEKRGFGGRSSHFGDSMGICAGDLAFFMGFELASRCGVSEIPVLFSQELSLVGLGQMQDVYFGYDHMAADEYSILSLYRTKTARYTFSLPLLAGAVLADADETSKQRLSSIGETLGIVFQIKDDDLGLFGDEAEIGKPVASDLREGKVTLAIRRLYDRLDDAGRKRLSGLLGNPGLGLSDINWVKEMMESSGVREELSHECESKTAECLGVLKEIPAASSEASMALFELLTYNLERRK